MKGRTKLPKTVVSSTGFTVGRIYWSDAEKSHLFVWYSPMLRKRIKKRLRSVEDARTILDNEERATLEGVDEPRTRYLTEDEQVDAVSALIILGGRMSLTRAARIAVERSLARPEHGTVKDTDTIDCAIDCFLKHKESEGRSPSTILTYKCRFRPLLDMYSGSKVRDLTRKCIARICRSMTRWTAYAFLTAVGSLESYILESDPSSSVRFSPGNVREAAKKLSGKGEK